MSDKGKRGGEGGGGGGEKEASMRPEERRVGEEGRYRWAPFSYK